jgi:hypothetical protein
VEISIHDRCIKFEQTDIFVYEEDPKEVFMAYMMEDQQVEVPKAKVIEEEMHPETFVLNSIQQHQQPALSIFEPSSNSSRRNNMEINTSYISSDFVDYTSSTLKNNLTSLVGQNNLK